MSKKNDNDNIETINLTPRKGVIDLSFFDDLTDQLKFKTEICETTRDFVKDALEDAVSRSDIGHVDLSMQDASEFEDGLESDDNRLNGVVYSGEDDKYTYFVSVMMGYDDEMGEDEEEDYSDFEAMLDDDYDDEGYDEDVVDAPDSTCVCLIRSEKENKTVCQQFDFEKEEWVHLDYEDFTGLTSDQVSILSAGDDPVKSNILMMYRNEYGNIDDKDFNKFCDDNKAIIELFRRADRFTYLTVFDKHKLVLLPNSNYDGGMVTYEDGFYCLCSSFLCEPLKKVYKTKNIDDILLTMANIFDKCFYEDTIAVVPLSDLAFAVFRGSGNIEIFFQNTGKERSEMTAQEQAVVEEYICKINSFTDQFIIVRKSLAIASIAAIGGCSLIAASAAKPPLMVLAYKSSSFAADYDSITDKDLISGKWRGVLDDENTELSLNKDGGLKAVHDHKKENGKWDLKKDRLEIKIGDKKYTFTYDRKQDAILYDGNYVFKRLSDIAEDDNNAEVRIDAVSSEFLGKWKAVNIENTKGEISVYPDVLKTTTVTLEITEKKIGKDSVTESDAGKVKVKGSKLSMDLKIHGDTDKSTISGISSTFTMGAITFQIANPIESSIIETGKRSDGKVFILENGMLSMTLTDGENRTTLYMTKEAEE